MDCSTFETLPPVYFEVKKSTLNHVGIGDPDNPYNYSEVAPYVLGYAIDALPPFVVVIPELKMVDVTVYPCGDPATGIPGVTAGASLDAIRVICSGDFAPIIAGKPGTKGAGYIFAGKTVFYGLDQVVSYINHKDTPPPSTDFDVTFMLENGDNPQEYTGFTAVIFNPYDPTLPNGDGSYFFVVRPSAKIKTIS